MSKKNINFVINLVSCFLLFVLVLSLILEYFFNMTPCVLCQIQRFNISFMILIIQFCRLNNYRVFSCCYLLFIVFNILGLSLAIRHVWLQNQPVDINIQCLPALSVLWGWLPISDFFTTIIKGSALCQKITWQFMGLSLAMWLALLYTLVLIYWLTLLKKSNHS